MKDSVMRKKNKRNMNTKSFVSKIIATEQGFHLKPPENYKESQRAIFIIRDHKFGDLAAMFNNIQIEKRVDRIVNILKKVEPSLTDLSLGTNRMIYCDIGLDKLMSINILGDGIIKLFSIISAISEMSGGGILLIDEIENGFHHETQKILWDSIFKAAKDFNVQIFATTHSIECVEAFSNAYYDSELEKDAIRLYRIEKEKDDFNVVIYDHKSLISSLEDNWEVR